MTETARTTVDTVLDSIQYYPVFITVKKVDGGESLIFLASTPDDVELNIAEGDIVQEYDYDTEDTPDDNEIVHEENKNVDILKGKCPIKDDATKEVLDPDDPNDPANQKELDDLLMDEEEEDDIDLDDDEEI